MAGKDIIKMRSIELKRLHLVKKILEKELKQVEASRVLRLSTRQIRRIVKRVKNEGEEGIVHKSRGRPSNRKITDKIRTKVINLYEKNYKGFGPTLASEMLFERDKIEINDETLRLWLIAEGKWEKRRGKRKHRQWRPRKEHFGEMVQMDGSHHDWFEGRGEKCVLMGYIDDASSKYHGRFYKYEGTLPAMDSLKRYIKKNGIPHSIYLDKHPTYKSTAKPTIEDELNCTLPMSQLQRASKELGIIVIHADSAQAKGRVERSFKTHQDRMAKMMRLEKISNVEDANRFLGKYMMKHNKKFSVAPVGAADFHRAVPKGLDLDFILCKKTKHPIHNDFTVVHEKHVYQILDKTNAKSVEVQERTNGRMYIYAGNTKLHYKEIEVKTSKHHVKGESVEKISYNIAI